MIPGRPVRLAWLAPAIHRVGTPNPVGFYGAGEMVGFDAYRNVGAWLERGLEIPKRPT